MEQEIKNLIEKNYKTIEIESVRVQDEVVVIRCYMKKWGTEPYIALRILNKYPKFRLVWFTGGWMEGVYTRETLKWGGYNVK